MRQTVLLVDADVGSLYAAASIMCRAGYTVAPARDRQRALQIVEDQRPLDLLIIDVVPQDSASLFAFARQAQLQRPDLKVLYLTGGDLSAHDAVGKILRKPIDDSSLLAAIRHALNGGG